MSEVIKGAVCVIEIQMAIVALSDDMVMIFMQVEMATFTVGPIVVGKAMIKVMAGVT
jgi:hypothetical protein